MWVGDPVVKDKKCFDDAKHPCCTTCASQAKTTRKQNIDVGLGYPMSSK